MPSVSAGTPALRDHSRLRVFPLNCILAGTNTFHPGLVSARRRAQTFVPSGILTSSQCRMLEPFVTSICICFPQTRQSPVSLFSETVFLSVIISYKAPQCGHLKVSSDECISVLEDNDYQSSSVPLSQFTVSYFISPACCLACVTRVPGRSI
jgi:hypothetical protein